MAKQIQLGEYSRGSYDEPGVLEELSKRLTATHTPDFLEMKLRGIVPVFVYGTLRRGFHNHHYLEDLPYLGAASTTIEKYEMRDAAGGSFPVVFERKMKDGKRKNPVAGRIIGEVYAVDPRTMLSLDRLEDNGRMYHRTEQWIFLDEQKIHNNAKFHPSIKCYMYIGNEYFWQGRAANIPCSSKIKNSQKFYDWSDTDTYEPNAYGYLAQ